MRVKTATKRLTKLSLRHFFPLTLCLSSTSQMMSILLKGQFKNGQVHLKTGSSSLTIQAISLSNISGLVLIGKQRSSRVTNLKVNILNKWFANGQTTRQSQSKLIPLVEPMLLCWTGWDEMFWQCFLGNQMAFLQLPLNILIQILKITHFSFRPAGSKM